MTNGAKREKRARGQASFDLMLMAIIALIAFLALSKIYLDREATNQDTRQTLAATLLTAKIARTISTVAAAENSTSQTVVFGNESSELGSYTVCVNNSVVETLWGTDSQRSVAAPITAGSVTSANPSLALYACTAADRYNVTVQNVDGAVYLS